MVVMMSWKCAVCGYHLRSVLFRGGAGSEYHANPQTFGVCYNRLEPVIRPELKVKNVIPDPPEPQDVAG